jgi:hypothetical protein
MLSNTCKCILGDIASHLCLKEARELWPSYYLAHTLAVSNLNNIIFLKVSKSFYYIPEIALAII